MTEEITKTVMVRICVTIDKQSLWLTAEQAQELFEQLRRLLGFD